MNRSSFEKMKLLLAELVDQPQPKENIADLNSLDDKTLSDIELGAQVEQKLRKTRQLK